ncbi:MAG: hypothetical protein GY861_00970 [bacterium]|nr:hypothetical protein [bacterium]
MKITLLHLTMIAAIAVIAVVFAFSYMKVKDKQQQFETRIQYLERMLGSDVYKRQ